MTSLRVARGDEAVPSICEGDVWLVSDSRLRLTVDAPPAGRTTKQRPVVVLGRSEMLRSSSFDLVWGIPCTSSPKYSDGLLEVFLGSPDAGTTRATHVITYMLQPLHKSWLLKRIGSIDQEALDCILAAVGHLLNFPQ